MRKLAVVLALLGWLTVPSSACGQRTAPHATIRQARGVTVRVRLLDAVSARPIADADVEIQSDNGIRCIRAPCPTDGRSWIGRSDAGGFVMVPAGVIQAATTITAAGHGSADLVDDSEPGPGGAWTTELLPPDTAALAPHPIKLLDARSGRALAGAAARLEYADRGQRRELRLATNALGYIFVPFEIVARAADSTWVEVPGYRRAKVDYAWVRRKTPLEKR